MGSHPSSLLPRTVSVRVGWGKEGGLGSLVCLVRSSGWLRYYVSLPFHVLVKMGDESYPPGYIELDPEEDISFLSVRELKQRLDAAGISYAGCVEKQDLVSLLVAAPTKPAGSKDQKKGKEAFRSFIKGRVGSAAALSAEYETHVRGLSVSELKKVRTSRMNAPHA